MRFGKRAVTVGLIGSLAVNALLVTMLISSAAVMDQLSAQTERSTTLLADLLRQHRSTVSEADQLRDELKGCRIDLIKRVLGISEPTLTPPPPPARAKIS
jgi:hypothetical protein